MLETCITGFEFHFVLHAKLQKYGKVDLKKSRLFHRIG